MQADPPPVPRQPLAEAGQTPAVLYLGGFGRSGSTLVERMLSTVSGVVALGETVHLPERGLVENQSCGCGRPFADCPFWTTVGQRAFGGWAALDAQHLVASRREQVTNRRLAQLQLRVGGSAFYDGYLAAFYRAAAETGGARLLVDSSKHPAYAFAIRPHVDLRAVLVVRDSRGVAYSWAREVSRPEVSDGTSYMPTYTPMGSTFRWASYSLIFDALRLTGTPVLTLRYEDLVARPVQSIARVLEFARVPVDDGALAAVSTGSVVLGVDHTVAGNPMRFRQGLVQLRSDDEWRTAMAPRDRALVSLTSWPLRARYGYLDRGRRAVSRRG